MIHSLLPVQVPLPGQPQEEVIQSSKWHNQPEGGEIGQLTAALVPLYQNSRCGRKASIQDTAET